MLLVVALGGNALLQRGEALSLNAQWRNVVRSAKEIATLVQQGHQIVLCHGNGPQVGLLAEQAQAYKKEFCYPFDLLNAQTQSMIGYMLQQALQNQLDQDTIVTVVTQVVVDEMDEGFVKPSKFVGPRYTEIEASHLAKQTQWQMKREGKWLRRVIASPTPLEIVEIAAIRQLIQAGYQVICAGGGGIPVLRKENKYSGVEAVIDKDMTAALVAELISADQLIIVTDVEGVFEQYRQPNQALIKDASPNMLDKMTFAQGSMQPKINAASQFTRRTQRVTKIGSLAQLSALVLSNVGTTIKPDIPVRPKK